MVKTKTTETTEKFDENGKLVEKITRIEESDDDTVYYPTYNPVPLATAPSVAPQWWKDPMCTCNCSVNE